MQRLAVVISGLCAAAMMTAPVSQALAMPEAAAPRADSTADESWNIVPDDQLRDLRGGIDLGHLVANFAIQRVVEVDGIVVARMQIVISNLGALGNGGMPTFSISGPLAELVQIMSAPSNSGNTGAGTERASAGAQLVAALNSRAGEPTPAVTSSESPSPQSTAVAAAGSVPSPATAVAVANGTTAQNAPSSTPSTPVQSTTLPGATAPAAGAAASALPSTPALASSGSSGTAPASSAAISSGASLSAGTTKVIPLGTTGDVAVLTNLPNATALSIAIQNEVRAATIQTQTTISATLNGLSLPNAASLANSIRLQISAGH